MSNGVHKLSAVRDLTRLGYVIDLE
jgi:hypothetical protein